MLRVSPKLRQIINFVSTHHARLQNTTDPRIKVWQLVEMKKVLDSEESYLLRKYKTIVKNNKK